MQLRGNFEQRMILNTILFAGHHMIFSRTENCLQMVNHLLNKITADCDRENKKP
jgi:hypothetical protein